MVLSGLQGGDEEGRRPGEPMIVGDSLQETTTTTLLTYCLRFTRYHGLHLAYGLGFGGVEYLRHLVALNRWDLGGLANT